MMLSEQGVPLTPCGGSVCRRLKSRISRCVCCRVGLAGQAMGVRGERSLEGRGRAWRSRRVVSTNEEEEEAAGGDKRTVALVCDSRAFNRVPCATHCAGGGNAWAPRNMRIRSPCARASTWRPWIAFLLSPFKLWPAACRGPSLYLAQCRGEVKVGSDIVSSSACLALKRNEGLWRGGWQPRPRSDDRRELAAAAARCVLSLGQRESRKGRRESAPPPSLLPAQKTKSQSTLVSARLLHRPRRESRVHPPTGPAPPPVPGASSPAGAGSRSLSSPSTMRARTITSPVRRRRSTES